MTSQQTTLEEFCVEGCECMKGRSRFGLFRGGCSWSCGDCSSALNEMRQGSEDARLCN